MLSSDTRVMGRFADVVWYDLNGAPEKGLGYTYFILHWGNFRLHFDPLTATTNLQYKTKWRFTVNRGLFHMKQTPFCLMCNSEKAFSLTFWDVNS